MRTLLFINFTRRIMLKKSSEEEEEVSLLCSQFFLNPLCKTSLHCFVLQILSCKCTGKNKSRKQHKCSKPQVLNVEQGIYFTPEVGMSIVLHPGGWYVNVHLQHSPAAVELWSVIRRLCLSAFGPLELSELN